MPCVDGLIFEKARAGLKCSCGFYIEMIQHPTQAFIATDCSTITIRCFRCGWK
jgi:hypothetical protein